MLAIENFLKSKKPGIQKALLVTEHIASGNSIREMATILNNVGLDFDVATLSMYDKLYQYSSFFDNIELYFGKEESIAGADFYKKPQYSGVEKGISDDPLPHPTKRPDINYRRITQARKDVRRLAEALKKLI